MFNVLHTCDTSMQIQTRMTYVLFSVWLYVGAPPLGQAADHTSITRQVSLP
jgi:hypothetical protein